MQFKKFSEEDAVNKASTIERTITAVDDYDVIYIWKTPKDEWKLGKCLKKNILHRMNSVSLEHYVCEPEVYRSVFTYRATAHESLLKRLILRRTHSKISGSGFSEFRRVTPMQMTFLQKYFDWIEKNVSPDMQGKYALCKGSFKPFMSPTWPPDDY